MRICYVLLSPTFGMHQYTADLANHMALSGHEVHLVTTIHYPRDRYLPNVVVHTPVATHNTGFSAEGLFLHNIGKLLPEFWSLRPDLVHITGPHLWNVLLIPWFRRFGIPVIHTIHDLDPHSGTAYGRLLYGWNWLVIHLADQILVHGMRYRERLLARKVPQERITCTPLLHLFLDYTWLQKGEELSAQVEYEPWALFFGRLEHYKGVDHLITAAALLDNSQGDAPRLVLAGPGPLESQWAGALPPRVEVRDRLVKDDEALDLFRRCGLVVLPYLDATQSALVAAAYYFRKPVIVTWAGALPEYVDEGRTGWLVEPAHPASLSRYLAAALADPARLAQMGAAGRAWYDQQRANEQRILQYMYQRMVEEKQHEYGNLRTAYTE